MEDNINTYSHCNISTWERLNETRWRLKVEDLERWAVQYLKKEFLGWRTPPIELPAESVIEEIVKNIIGRTVKELEII